MRPRPRVSVIIAIGPNRDHLEEAFQSLIDQTFLDFEVLAQDEKELADARNAGFNRAVGEYVAIQDGDDISYPERFEKEVNYLDAHPDVSVVGSWGHRIGSRSGTCTPPEDVTLSKLFLWDRVIHASAMMRKADVLPFGPYRNTMFEDWNLWIRLVKAGKKIRNIQEPLVSFRFSKQSHSSAIPRHRWYMAQAMERLKL